MDAYNASSRVGRRLDPSCLTGTVRHEPPRRDVRVLTRRTIATPARRSDPGHPARPARRGRRRLRRQDRAEPSARRRLDHELELPRARPAVADRRLAPARARARAGRPAADLVALDARAAGDLLRGDAGRPHPRPARPAHVGRRDRGHRPASRARATSSSAPAATPRIRARPAWTASRRRRVDALAADPDDTFPPDWEAQLAAWARPAAERRLRARLHLGHDRHARRA